MIIKQLSTIIFIFSIALAPINAVGIPEPKVAIAKAAIEGLTNYVKTANKEQVKRNKIRTRSFKTSAVESMARESFDVLFDFGVNCALDTIGGKNLCDGKDGVNGINTHKALAIVVAEAAKLLATDKFTPKKLAINVFRKLVEKSTIANGDRNQNIVFYLGLLAGTLNQDFYDDLEAGTVDTKELIKGLGKYRTLEGTVNTYGMGKLGAFTGNLAAGKYPMFNETKYTRHTAKAVGDLAMVPLKNLLFVLTKTAALALEHPEQFKKSFMPAKS